MKKIRLPEYDTFEDAYDELGDDVDSFTHFNGLVVIIDDEHDYLYGCITPTGYYDDAIVKTDDFGIKKRTKENLKRTYNKIIKQLNTRYEEWVNSLYIQE